MGNALARRSLRLAIGLVFIAALGFAARPAYAIFGSYYVVTLNVNTTTDNPADTCGSPGPPVVVSGPCSLRGAATFSNSASAAGKYYNIFVSVPSGTYNLNSIYGPITLNNGYSKTHFKGAGTAYTIVDGQNATQVFYNNASNLTLQFMTLQHGNGSGGNGGALKSSSGALALTDMVVQNNSAAGFDGGGLYLSDSTDNITRVTVRNNEAKYGGGVYDDASASNLVSLNVTGNFACVSFTPPSTCGGAGEGGGLWTDADVTVLAGQYTNNVAGSLSGLAGYGGGIYDAFEFYMSNARVAYNVAGNQGGGYYGVNNQYEAIHNTTISSNQAGNQGGGLWVSTVDFLTDDAISNNVAGILPTNVNAGHNGFGGGMYATGSNEEQLYGVTFTGNQAATTNTTPLGTCGGEGGGMYNASYVSISVSVFNGNHACNGGGLFDDTTSNGYLSMANSGMASNSATVKGGGLYSNFAGHPARIGLDAVSIHLNTAADAGGFFDNNNPAGFLESNNTSFVSNTSTAPSSCPNIGDLPCG